MTKMVRLTVRFPADDGLHVMQIRDHLRDALEERGIEVLDIASEMNGDDALVETPRKGRIYWPAAEVVLAVERAPPAQATKARKPREAA